MVDEESTAQEPQFKPRQGEPGAVYTFTTSEGAVVELAADDSGVLQPNSVDAEEAAKLFGLPIVGEEPEPEPKSVEGAPEPESDGGDVTDG